MNAAPKRDNAGQQPGEVSEANKSKRKYSPRSTATEAQIDAERLHGQGCYAYAGNNNRAEQTIRRQLWDIAGHPSIASGRPN